MAEKKNMTILNMVCYMLLAKYVPKQFWIEVDAYEIYHLNRCPTKGFEFMTPYEVWRDWTPSIKHLRVLGSITYTYVPSELYKKLNDKCKKCIFIGYSTVTKGYRLYNPIMKKVIDSRDVTFDEMGE